MEAGRKERGLVMTPTEAALDDVAQMLASDGFVLTIDETEMRLTITVRAGPDACDECLVPKKVLAGIISGRLAGAEGGSASSARELVVVYPTEIARLPET